MTTTAKQITWARVSGYDAALAAAAEAHVHVIAPEGELGEREMTRLFDEIVGLSCAGKVNLVLDLSGTNHVDYRQVRPLASRAAFLRQTNGDLKLCGLSPYLHAIFRAAGAWSQFEIFETAEEASAAFAADLI
jgi:anti-anti-sigma regulatory factor